MTWGSCNGYRVSISASMRLLCLPEALMATGTGSAIR